ncbi:hypothetical protein LHK99_08630 [Klebsiella quasipneumoniae]|uniref:Uncharacterized protein n=1 Tax=Klebsiella quasipneumoniae TaxID=1463165 RepID=A0AAI8IWH0_9ENTR|nr:hypothetical protein [Klebsiella quasipneumoniae]HBR1530903.1 hypothetical protein [Klebsiella quasipneumoniae subsp. quasipneumoniae]AWL56980.1 hypothetical protein DKC11_14610 [Klebsiella quasipneumoniae]AWL63632.1 hypothetical protein DKC00_18565 [Klebsiella quasipneumoniae]AWL74922.1 hypothetical protein DKC09_18285 [Klebsiella quasipneumoniae]EKZ5324519.1 hypothetical protein [Klebsiella quasipneumoniae]
MRITNMRFKSGRRISRNLLILFKQKIHQPAPRPEADDNRTLWRAPGLPGQRFNDLMNERLTAMRSIIAQIKLNDAKATIITNLCPSLSLPGKPYD